MTRHYGDDPTEAWERSGLPPAGCGTPGHRTPVREPAVARAPGVPGRRHAPSEGALGCLCVAWSLPALALTGLVVVAALRLAGVLH